MLAYLDTVIFLLSTLCPSLMSLAIITHNLQSMAIALAARTQMLPALDLHFAEFELAIDHIVSIIASHNPDLLSCHHLTKLRLSTGDCGWLSIPGRSFTTQVGISPVCPFAIPNIESPLVKAGVQRFGHSPYGDLRDCTFFLEVNTPPRIRLRICHNTGSASPVDREVSIDSTSWRCEELCLHW